MSRTVVQIPVSTELRDAAYKAAVTQGFSNLQEAMRVIMHNFSVGALKVEVFSEQKPVKLSAKAIKRYNKMDEDRKAGKFYTANSLEEFFQQLGYEPKN